MEIYSSTRGATGFARRAAWALATGSIFVFFSESMFWGATGPARMAHPGTIGTWLAYSLLAYVFLTVLARFRVRNEWTVFLAGAVFGWLGEGVLVQTTYESLPLSISFTGLAWHALISALVGWFWLGRALHRNDVRRTALLAIGLGLFWGVWSTAWLNRPAAAPLGSFATFAVAWSALLALSFFVSNRLQPLDFRPSRVELGALWVVFGAAFAAVVVAVTPAAAVVLPPLLALVYAAVRRSRRDPERMPRSEEAPPAEGVRAFAALALLPAAAILVYAVAVALGPTVASYMGLLGSWGVYLGTTAVGFAMFALSLRRTLRRPVAVQGQVAVS